MKKILILIVAIITTTMMFIQVKAEEIYNDGYGAVVTVPDGFEKIDNADSNFEAGWMDENANFIMHLSHDQYSDADEAFRKRYSREEVNNALFTKEDVAAEFGINESIISTKKYNGVEYFEFEDAQDFTVSDTTIKFYRTFDIALINGYAYIFTYWTPYENNDTRDYHEMLCLIDYPNPELAKSNSVISNDAMPNAFSSSNIVISFLITFAVYSLPVLIYRYLIARKKIEKGKAIAIVIVYAIASFIFMHLVFMPYKSWNISFVVITYALINYGCLTSGSDNGNQTIAN